MKFTKVVKAEEDIRLLLTNDLKEKVFDCISDCIADNVQYKNLSRTDLLTAISIALNKTQAQLDDLIK